MRVKYDILLCGAVEVGRIFLSGIFLPKVFRPSEDTSRSYSGGLRDRPCSNTCTMSYQMRGKRFLISPSLSVWSRVVQDSVRVRVLARLGVYDCARTLAIGCLCVYLCLSCSISLFHFLHAVKPCNNGCQGTKNLYLVQADIRYCQYKNWQEIT